MSSVSDLHLQPFQYIQCLFVQKRVEAGRAGCVDKDLRLRQCGLCKNSIRNDAYVAYKPDKLDASKCAFLKVSEKKIGPEGTLFEFFTAL